MADVLGHKWMRGEVITKQQFADHCSAFMEKAKADRIAEQSQTGVDYSIPASTSKANRRGGGEDAVTFDTEYYMSHAFKAAPEQRLGEKSTQFLVNAKALDIMTGIYKFSQSEKTDKAEKVVVSTNSWKIKFDGKLWSEAEEPI